MTVSDSPGVLVRLDRKPPLAVVNCDLGGQIRADLRWFLGALTSAPRPAAPAPQLEISAPHPAPPRAPGLARAARVSPGSRPPGRPPTYFAQASAALLENPVPAPRAAYVTHRVPARGAARAALAHIRAPRLCADVCGAGTRCGTQGHATE